MITPDRLAVAAARAEAERKRIHDEGHAKGKHEGLRLAGRYRDGALVAIGVLIGLAIGSFGAMSMLDRGAYTAAAITDRVLGRTVPPVSETLPPAPATRAPDEEYRANVEAARGGCTEAQLRAGIRRCGVEPGTPPQRRN